ncbi:hypothetical protein D3C87_1667210 [compost metagenome]
MVLLIGKNVFQASPVKSSTMPAMIKIKAFFEGLKDGDGHFKNWPVNTPSKAEAIAGKVDNKPSGS